jgi:HSP20 family protein
MATLPVRQSGRNQTTIVNPSREFEDIYDRMGQLMNLAFGLGPIAELGDQPWSPLADLSETDDAYVVKVDVPGVHKDQVEVQVQDHELIVSGEIPEPAENGQRRHRRSRRTGKFALHTYLPGDINGDAVRAELADGVLTVTVPKAEASKPHKVEITG